MGQLDVRQNLAQVLRVSRPDGLLLGHESVGLTVTLTPVRLVAALRMGGNGLNGAVLGGFSG